MLICRCRAMLSIADDSAAVSSTCRVASAMAGRRGLEDPAPVISRPGQRAALLAEDHHRHEGRVQARPDGVAARLIMRVAARVDPLMTARGPVAQDGQQVARQAAAALAASLAVLQGVPLADDRPAAAHAAIAVALQHEPAYPAGRPGITRPGVPRIGAPEPRAVPEWRPAPERGAPQRGHDGSSRTSIQACA